MGKNIEFGDIFPISKFIEYVENGYIISYDGSGYYLDENCNECGSVSFNVKELKKMSKKYKRVVWYNR